MINTIVSKFKTFVAIFFLKLALVLDRPNLAVLALSSVAWRIGKGEYRVLALGRTIFVDDVKAMAKYSGKIEYIVVHLQYFEVMLSYFVPPHERKLITEANYLTINAGRAGRARYREFLNRVLPKLRSKLGFQAILSPQVSYVVQQELMVAAAGLDLPFIVLHKEALDVYGGILEIYRNYKFLGTKVLFYNNKIREELIKRIAGLTFENTEVVGIPRFDHYFQEQRAPRAKTIVFFSFFPNDKFTATIKDEHTLTSLREAYANFHKLVIDFAARHPDFQITIKTKAAQHYRDYVLDICRQFYPHPPPNLTITNYANVAGLIFDAQAVIGFDSTVLIEALACSRPIIRPDFREISDSDSWDFLADFEGLVNYAKSYEDLEAILLEPEKLKIDLKLRQICLEGLIGSAQGNASLKTEQAVIETINQFR